MRNGLYILVLLFALACPKLSFADLVMMSISPAGKGVFVLTGQNVIGVQALDITIEYDSTLLANPYVSINGGEVASLDASAPGTLLISVSRADAGPILQLSLNFEVKSNAAGGIYNVSASSRDAAGGKPSNADGSDTSFSSPSTDSDAAQNGTEVAADAASSADTSTKMQQRGNPAPQAKSDNAAGSSAGTDPALAARAVGQPAVVDTLVHAEDKTATFVQDEQSVLQRFRKFKGENGLKAFTALFERSDGNRIEQEPAVALSDGKTPVTLKLNLLQAATHSLDIALCDAKLVSVQKMDQTTLLITVMPSKGTWDARLVLAAGTEMMEFPIVVAPPIKIVDGINEKNFLAALNAYISDQAPTLQKEDKFYLYEYIFTANYLATTAVASVKTASW